MRSMTVTSTLSGNDVKRENKPVQVILDPGTDPFGVVRLQHRRPGIAGAKETPVRQLGTILDRQAADVTTGQLDAVGTDLLFFTGDLVGDEVNRVP